MSNTLYVPLNNKNNKYFTEVKELLKTSKKDIEEIKKYKSRTNYLKNNNSKLGKGIYSFDLPAVISCPDSDSCFKTCYANKGSFLYKSTKVSNTYNYIIALHDINHLKSELIREIKINDIRTIRIHSSGDFFSKEYFLLWVAIANKFKDTLKIFTYSKAPQIENFTLPNNFNIISSFIDYNNKKVLNYGQYAPMKKIAKSVKGLLCPISKGNHLNLDKLKSPNFNCTICKYCITKSKPLFVQH